MRFLAVIPLALLSMGAAPPNQPDRPAASAPEATATKAPRAEALPGEILLTGPAHCIDAEPRRTDGQTLGPRRLDQLPQGNLSLTVMREVNGCPQPTTIREGYGAPAFRR
jgi:hypothetical protein